MVERLISVTYESELIITILNQTDPCLYIINQFYGKLKHVKQGGGVIDNGVGKSVPVLWRLSRLGGDANSALSKVCQRRGENFEVATI